MNFVSVSQPTNNIASAQYLEFTKSGSLGKNSKEEDKLEIKGPEYKFDADEGTDVTEFQVSVNAISVYWWFFNKCSIT